MSLEDRMLLDAVAMLNVNEHATDLELWPSGKEANKIPFVGIMNESGLPGTNEAQGDGRVNNSKASLAVRESIEITCMISPPSVVDAKLALLRGEDVTVPTGQVWFQRFQSEQNPDIVVRVSDGLKAHCRRIISRDEVMMTLLAGETKFVRTQSGIATG